MNSSRQNLRSTLVMAALLLLAPWVVAQEGEPQPDTESARIDSILRQMSDFLTSAQSFGFTAHELIDQVEEDQRIQYSNTRSMLVRRPNRIVTEAYGDLVNRSVWYDGKSFTLLDREFNSYIQAPAPDSIDALLDQLEAQLEVVVPLGEILSEDVYQTLKPQIRQARYLGLHQVQGIECHHIIFTQKDLDLQLWVDASSTPVPRKLVIVYKREPGIPQYAAVISDWDFTVATPDELFEFHPPEGAREINMSVPMAP
jgi:hypothetical protein